MKGCWNKSTQEQLIRHTIMPISSQNQNTVKGVEIIVCITSIHLNIDINHVFSSYN